MWLVQPQVLTEAKDCKGHETYVITGIEYSGFIFNILHHLCQRRIFRTEFKIQEIQKFDHILLFKNPSKIIPQLMPNIKYKKNKAIRNIAVCKGQISH